MLWLGILVAIVCLLILLLILPLEVRIHYHHLNEDDGGVVEIRYLFGLIHIQKELVQAKMGMSEKGPTLAVNDTSPEASHPDEGGKKVSLGGILQDIQPLMQHVKQSRPILKRLAPHIHVREFHLEASIGAEDAVYTGMATGVLYAAIEGLLGIVSHHCRFHGRPRVKIHPVYQGLGFHIRMDSIIQVRLGYAINAVRKLVLVWKRRT